MSKPAPAARSFDGVEMKRRIQERIYAETRDMGQDELLSYFHGRVAASRFAPFFGLKRKNQPRERARRRSGTARASSPTLRPLGIK